MSEAEKRLDKLFSQNVGWHTNYKGEWRKLKAELDRLKAMVAEDERIFHEIGELMGGRGDGDENR